MEPVLLRDQWSQEATKEVELEHISAWISSWAWRARPVGSNREGTAGGRGRDVGT